MTNFFLDVLSPGQLTQLLISELVVLTHMLVPSGDNSTSKIGSFICNGQRKKRKKREEGCHMPGGCGPACQPQKWSDAHL